VVFGTLTALFGLALLFLALALRLRRLGTHYDFSLF
jgi:hypothetical protein